MAKKALVIFVPVIHTGYIRLFKQFPDNIFLIGEDILKDWEGNVYLHRDKRRVDEKTISEIIKNIDSVKSVKILDKNNLNLLGGHEIVMPDEDVSHWFAEEQLENNNVDFKNIFLRWNKTIVITENEVSTDRLVTEDEMHKEFISRAVKLSEKSANWWRQIGTLAVKDEKVVMEAFNKHVPTQHNVELYGDLRSSFDPGELHEISNSIHGEAFLVAKSAKEGISLKGADLYVTTFPCPTCAKLVAESGIKRVYYKDGYSLADAEDVLKSAGVEIILVK
jgi:dCMP deaminase